MTRDLFAELAWLPEPPEDIGAQCRALAGLAEPGTMIRHLASHALDANGLTRLAKAIDRARADNRPLTPLVPFRLGLLGNGTLDLLVPAVVATAARYGIDLECTLADYGQTIQEALDVNSRINQTAPDAVLLALDYRALPLRISPGATDAGIDVAISHLATMRAAFRQNCGAISIVQTLAPPPEGLFGSFDRVALGTSRSVLHDFNAALVETVRQGGDALLDVAAIAETVGLAQWHSPAQWNLAKLPFADEYVPLYAEHIARLIAALRGKSRRCLILDLDNTVWGGVIGDDGLEGIRLAQGDATGEAHLAVQRLALDLRERGIVLAVSSKNNDEVARLPFQKHPEMLLREQHIAVFQANWNDKATNISAIAEELSLGLDAMVLLDDNPAERSLIRRQLPQVAVPELPPDPALYARTLAAAGYFESVTFSEEDRKRAEFYQDNARRVTLQKSAVDLESYLESLEMEIVFQPFDKTGRARITQLINKSNQFNLTTRRYSETEVAEVQQDPSAFTLQVRLADRFGDNGMISVVICRARAASVWEIDTWLMSCRVLGRQVETMVLREVLQHARRRGIELVIGKYIPTERNGIVRDHYAKLGFRQVKDRPDGSDWEIDTDTIVPEGPMRVCRIDAGVVAV